MGGYHSLCVKAEHLNPKCKTNQCIRRTFISSGMVGDVNINCAFPVSDLI